MIIFLLSNNNIRIITRQDWDINFHFFAEEPHAPQIKRDDELRQDVGGAFAGPFNEGEELKLLCEVHGGKTDTVLQW